MSHSRPSIIITHFKRGWNHNPDLKRVMTEEKGINFSYMV